MFTMVCTPYHFSKMYYFVENIKANDCQQHMDEVGGSLLGSDLQ